MYGIQTRVKRMDARTPRDVRERVLDKKIKGNREDEEKFA
jgi:hypothetical protein